MSQATAIAKLLDPHMVLIDLSIIIDGMDQSKTNLPHLIRERKSGSNLWRLRCVFVRLLVFMQVFVCVSLACVMCVCLDVAFEAMNQQITFHGPRTHVTAAIVHGQGTYAYIDVHSWPHDSNLTINILLDILMRQEFLPPVLYLQLDNTARENKNQYTLSFLSYLVQMRIFSEVNLQQKVCVYVCISKCALCNTI